MEINEETIKPPSAQSQKNISHASHETIILDNETIYDALQRRKLLRTPGPFSIFGVHLVSQGQIGLSMHNGNPMFLYPGRYTFLSAYTHFVGVSNITDALIRLGPIEIVTINQGEIGLSMKNGENILLDPGRYILTAPHIFVNKTSANQNYIKLGTYVRLVCPKNAIFIAFDQGKQFIISSEDTKNGPFETTSPTFNFNPETGMKSTQLQVKELDVLKVNTKDGITITTKGLLTYIVRDPYLAFIVVNNIDLSLKRTAESILTNIFLNISIDQIAPSVPSADGKQKKPILVREQHLDENEDFSRYIRNTFLHDFKTLVSGWGVEITNLTIEQLDYDKNIGDLLRKRAQARLETATNLANMFSQTEIAVQEAHREYESKKIKSEAESNAVKIASDAEFYRKKRQAEADAISIETIARAEYIAAEQRSRAAELLSKNQLASKLEVKRLDIDIVKATGNKTTFLPLGTTIKSAGITGPDKDPIYWTNMDS
ncbi:MAG: SPFH domain / Band 7 domain containing protein [Satyrvirus sp.]|uniref:SPFH domain / Band 7 domain containing protein n=1 Tax=Satyrvirus sp. TaxID=2487771 RepID=A0A3G5AH88_9VIRU|nr:MAG: SPFH domain / Band 7 domain containing protein [Satyrvirus sp.]